jgi:hypothetical protein
VEVPCNCIEEIDHYTLKIAVFYTEQHIDTLTFKSNDDIHYRVGIKSSNFYVNGENIDWETNAPVKVLSYTKTTTKEKCNDTKLVRKDRLQ